ncbi:hypothetical protein CY652_13175 [Burkholderia sp. WAC0059]|uniref:hypothetical protein n=1 Tax=Burkholderia sp. WAC0059 TaxID=2066022 RepID=UPI000C7F2BBD|nr:hypothetical protein [Burkholderia sp. WAC0059]PLZ01975.1 hypothetical protein CY652_13175 [Burkholderia sp. WAC0059]
MSRLLRLLAAAALASTLAACVVTRPIGQQPRPAPAPTQHDFALERLRQVDGRIDDMGRHIDMRVGQGAYPQAQGAQLHHRLDVIREEAHSIASQHDGGLSSPEQRMLNDELDTAGHVIDE